MADTIRPPQQARSRDTLRRILAGARSVIAQAGFDGASITAIVARAGVSVGAFYQRFDSKEGLLHALHEETIAHNIELMRTAFAPQRWDGKGAYPLVELLIRGSFRVSERDAGFQRACYQKALTDEVFAGREASVRHELAKLVIPLLVERLPHLPAAERRGRAEFCLTMIVAIVSEYESAALFPTLVARPSRDELADQLFEICREYLQIGPVTP